MLKIRIHMKLTQATEIQILNPETGEIQTLESSKTFTGKVNEDAFYMTFIDFIAPFYKLKSDNAKSLLNWMCTHAEFNTGKVLLTTAIRKQIAEELGISTNTITNNLKVLKDAKLISGEQGNFEINPQIFWKGDLNIRRRLLKERDFVVKFGIE